MVELIVTDILSRSMGDKAYIMLLQERDGMRKLPVMIGPFEAQSVFFAKRNVRFERPTAHDLFKDFADAMGVTLKYVKIYKIQDGTFYSRLIFDKEGTEVVLDARTSDAVSVAMRCGAPIYIEDELLNVLCIKEEWENAFSIPISLAGTNTLHEILERAVKDENYELAMKLKQEIDARAARKESGNGD